VPYFNISLCVNLYGFIKRHMRFKKLIVIFAKELKTETKVHYFRRFF